MKFEKVSLGQYIMDCTKGLKKEDLKGNKEEIAKALIEEWQRIKLPQRATKYSAGYDIYSQIEFVLEPGQTVAFPLGIKVQLDSDKTLMIVPRSGSGFKYGINLWNTIGVIDADFWNNPNNEGHIHIKLRNTGTKNWKVSVGDAIAQGIIVQYFTVDDDSSDGERLGGFGSTDQKRMDNDKQ